MKKFFINKFFFTITPSPPIQVFVSNLKKQVRNVIGHGFQSEFSKVHISLFQYNEHHTDNILYDAIKINCTELFYYTGTMIEFESGTNKANLSPFDFGNDIATFNEEALLSFCKNDANKKDGE